MYKNPSMMCVFKLNIRELFWILIFGCTVGILCVRPTWGIPLILSGLLLLGLSLIKWPYKLIDIPFLVLIMGAFIFGRAFSVLGVKVWIVPLFVTEMALLCALGLILFRGKIDNFSLWLPQGLGLGLFFYLVLGTVYLVFGLFKNNMLAFRDIVFCHYAVFLFMAIMVFKNEERLKTIFWISIPCCILTFLVGLNMVFKFVPDGSPLGRFLSETKNFNLNLYYGFITIFGLSFLFYVRRRRIIVGLLVMFSLLLSVLLRVRTGWFASIVALAFLFFILGDEFKIFIKRYWLILIILFIAVIILFSVLFPGIGLEIKNEWRGLWHRQRDLESGGNVLWRLYVWNQTIDQIVKRPFLGWGFGAQPYYFVENWFCTHTPESIGPGSGIIPAHNHILAITFKMGLLGLFLFLFINIKIFVYGLSYLRQCKSEFNRRFLIASITCIVYWHGMALFFDIMESPPTSIFLWILLGLVLSVIYVDKKIVDIQVNRY